MITFYGFLASLGFALLFNVPKEKVIYAGLCGGIGSFFYWISGMMQSSEFVSLFIAAVALTSASEILARVIKCPSTLFLICALIPFVPGSGMYYTVLSLIEEDNSLALNYGLNTIADACAIVLGCVLVTSFVHIKRKREK